MTRGNRNMSRILSCVTRFRHIKIHDSQRRRRDSRQEQESGVIAETMYDASGDRLAQGSANPHRHLPCVIRRSNQNSIDNPSAVKICGRGAKP